MEKEITCTVCPMGCRITVCGEGEVIRSVKGYTCARGEQYARSEFVHPVRILTSTALVSGSNEPLVAVRSNRPLPKELLMNCMKKIHMLHLQAPVYRYQVLIPNIMDTGVDIVASGEAKRQNS
jgi:CxxC motif-containing protein